MTLQIKNWMKKSQHMLTWLSKIVLAQLAEAAKKHSKA
jgi:hypothetical protein